jgi:hypothetical protein
MHFIYVASNKINLLILQKFNFLAKKANKEGVACPFIIQNRLYNFKICLLFKGKCTNFES